jgi:hypothetical protein
MLNPGEYALEYTPDLTILGPGLKRLTAIDSLGRKWKAPGRQVRRLKREYASGKLGQQMGDRPAARAANTDEI